MYQCQSGSRHTIHCRGNRKGASLGRVLFLPDSLSADLCDRKSGASRPSSVTLELEKYDIALKKIKHEREALYLSLKDECDASWIFLMHVTLLHSSLFTHTAREYIIEGKSAQEAIRSAGEHFLHSVPDGMDGDALRSVSLDVEDVCTSLISMLCGTHTAEVGKQEDAIIFSDAPLPSFIAKNRGRISGMVCPSVIGHCNSYELLSALSVPTLLCDEEPSLFYAYDKEYAIVDSDRGTLHLCPDLATLEDFSERQEKRRKYEKRLSDLAELPLRSADGKRISLFAEVKRSVEVEPSLPSRCDGIGILSCEELYLEHLCMPDEDALFECYREAAELMPTKPVIIRALRSSAEVRVNSMVSERGGEVYVFQSAALKLQLRAAMRASVFGRVYFLISPQGSRSAVLRCKRICEEAAEELREEGREFSAVQIALELSTPAEALTCTELIAEASLVVVNVGMIAALLDGEICEKERTVGYEAMDILLSQLAMIKRETRKNFLISLGKKTDIQILKKALLLGFDAFSVSTASLPETKLTISELYGR